MDGRSQIGGRGGLMLAESRSADYSGWLHWGYETMGVRRVKQVGATSVERLHLGSGWHDGRLQGFCLLAPRLVVPEAQGNE